MKKTLQLLVIVIGTVFLAWFLLPLLIYGTLFFGNIVGMLASVLLVLYGVKFNKVNAFINNLWNKNKLAKLFVKLFAFVMACCFVLAGVELKFILSPTKNAEEQDATVVVLGCSVVDGKPSVTMQDRLNAAYVYLQNHPDSSCIVTGGLDSYENVTEAEVMYKWMLENGIDKNRLYVEDKSTSTRENLAFAKTIIEENNLNDYIVIATSDYHLYRAGLIADKMGIEHGGISAQTNFVFLPSSYLRELFSVVYEWSGLHK